jgi:lipoprotein-releasing system permease protein
MLCELWLSQRYLRAGKKEKIISITALISTIGIAIGVLVLIVVIAVMSGFDRFLEDKMIGSSSHLLLEFYRGTKEPYQIIENLKKNPHILAASPYVAGQAVIKIGQDIIAVEMRGIDPKLQPEISKIKEYLIRGSLSMEPNEIILGEELAMKLGLELGDKIGLFSPVNLAKTDFIVKGLFKSGMYLYDTGLVLVSLKGAQDFFKFTDLVSGIGIKVDDIYKVEPIKQEIYRKLEHEETYHIRTWVEVNQNFLNALKLEKVVMFIVVAMTTVVAAFGIASTLIMSVMSRIKDIGILRSIGASTKSILEIFIFQGLGIGITGIAIGLISGISLANSLNKVVDFISRLIGRNLIPKEIYYFERIPTYINSSDISLILVCALGIILLASVYPAFYASRIMPCEALRHE